MDGLPNSCNSLAQYCCDSGNADGPAENEKPEAPGSTESTARYLPDTSAHTATPPPLAKSLDARSVMKEIVLSAKKFVELLNTGKALSNDLSYVIEDSLRLSRYNCPLTDFTGNLHVKNDFTITDCLSLSDVSGNITVGRGLYIHFCPELTDVSGKITAGNNIRILYCNSLTSLSGNISTDGDLTLGQCPRLRSLSGTLSPGSHLFLYFCPQLTTLPDWITTLGATHNGSIREVCFRSCGLSSELIDRLHNAQAPGMRFTVFGRHSELTHKQFDNFQMAFAFWRELAACDEETPELTLLPQQSHELVIFLEKLTATADYDNLATRPVLAQRIVHALLSVLGKEQTQNMAMNLIHDAISTCSDRIILALDDLETLELVDRAITLAVQHEDPTELINLGKKMMRKEQVNRIVQTHAASLPWVDEVEVALAYQIGIRKHLELPGTTRHMRFRRLAQVSDQDIDKALAQLHSKCGEKQLAEFLTAWGPWQIYQRHLAVPRFDQLPLQSVDQIRECPIDREIKVEMVMLNNTHMSYQALCRAFELNGNNPLTNTPLDWSVVVRLTEADCRKRSNFTTD